MVQCEPWDESAEVSHVSYLPEFKLIGGEFLSYQVNELDTFVDPGFEATSNGVKVSVLHSSDTVVKVDEVGLYAIGYYAENSDGLGTTKYRYVSITHNNVSKNDLTGKYYTDRWGPRAEMKVTRENDKGYYKCTEVFGYPGAEMKGKFVDLGKGDLVLLPGNGYFGDFGLAEGSYTRSTLSLVVSLLNEPYDGLSFDVLWRKTE